jgi:hypothetical protein
MGEVSAAVKRLAEAGEECFETVLRGLRMIPSGAPIVVATPSFVEGDLVGHSQRSRPFPFARRRLAQHAIGAEALRRAGPPASRMNRQPVSTHRGAS